MLNFISLLMVVLCFSCSSGKVEKTENDACVTVDLAGYLESDEDNKLSLSALIDSLEYVPLQTPDDLPVDILLTVSCHPKTSLCWTDNNACSGSIGKAVS